MDIQKTLIEEVCQQIETQGLIIRDDTPLEEAINRYASGNSRSGMYLVDEAGRLTGVVKNADLLDWAELQFNLVSPDERLPLGQIRRLLAAQTIGDIALPDSRNMTVRMSDTLEYALRKMARYKLAYMPVVDENGRIVNDLRLAEVLTYALGATLGP